MAKGETYFMDSLGHLRRPEALKYVFFVCFFFFYGLSNFIGYRVGRLFQLVWKRGEDFQELGHYPLFGVGLSWSLWVCYLAC